MLTLWPLCAVSSAAAPIVIAPQASAIERFAAREAQRYVYLRTGELLPIALSDHAPDGAAIVLTSAGHPLAQGGPAQPGPEARSYRLAPGGGPAAPQQWIVGRDDIGVLYGAYRLAEHFGVRFYLHGDVVPDDPERFAVPQIREDGRPLFAVRGIQPFHDFAEGPDWWDADGYRAIIGQLPKLRMNFLGLHTYPDGGTGPEPTVWIGLPGRFDERGRVRTAYPASYHTTARGGRYWWAYAPLRTGEFLGGAAELYERDDFGSEVMRGHDFEGQTPAGAAEVFNRTGEMLGTAFRAARRLGVLTCIGTETPLTLPAAVRDELVREGRDPRDAATIREVYTGMFERIARISPVDYYWLWTPEGWTWEGNKPEAFAATARDIEAALGALQDLGHPMTLATCGWVLGPQFDRSALDRLLPPASPMSAINASVGHTAIERRFANLSTRPRWAIPWLENDGGLISPQLWAGRMRFDAADARRLGCDGLIGIHWRTKLMAPNVAALAAAAWDQRWTPPDFDPARIPPQTSSGADGGHALAATGGIAGDGDLAPFRTVRAGMRTYDMLVPNGRYAVTLGFIELENRLPGERVFDVTLPDKPVATHLDLAAQAGVGRALRYTIKDVKISNGRLPLRFTAIRGEPVIASIEIDGTTDVGPTAYRRRINCGGPVHDDFEADDLPGLSRPPEDRAMPVADFYRDFAAAHFGPEAAGAAGSLFARIDGIKLPLPAGWIDGPGDILPNDEPWSVVAPRYGFVDDFAALRKHVHGAAALGRFDYWLNQFRAFRLIAELGCTAGELNRTMASLAGASGAAATQRARAEALPLRLKLATLWTELLQTEIAGADTTGELGTIANLEQRTRTHQQFLTRHDAALRTLLGCDLPVAAAPSRTYEGPNRLIVPVVRTSAGPGEVLAVRVIAAAAAAPSSIILRWRWAGERAYHEIPLRRLARQVYEATLPALTTPHPLLEYHFEAACDAGAIRWPLSDREANQTIVLLEND